jgi:diaminopimelate decarboxylase
MNDYYIDSFRAIDIAEEFGTPVFVYNSHKIRDQYLLLSKAFEDLSHRIFYACKANESPSILKILKDLGAGVDTVSPNEILRSLKLGYKPGDIIFTPSCPGLQELELALEQGIIIHFGSLEYLEMLGNKLSGKEIGIRLNPAIAIEGNQKISTAHANSKFGVPLDQLEKLQRLTREYRIKLKTYHIHTGSDVKGWQDLAKSFDVLISLLRDFPTVDKLDIGSGFKVKYSANDHQVDLNAYANYLLQKINEVEREICLIIEPGKYLVAEAGYLITRVNVVKKGYSKTFVGTNSGFHHLIRPMYYDAYHHIVNLSNPSGAVQLYDVVGQLCEEDTFARDIPLNEVRPGDYLIFENAGAYAYAMSTIYNLREKPLELLLENDQIRIISAEKIQI